MADMNNQQDVDDFMAANPNWLDNMKFDDIMTDNNTDTESVNPADLSFNTNFGNGFQAPQEMVPAQPEQQQMVQQAPQMPAMGACYHPMVGWYFPANAPTGIPPAPMYPMAAMTPASSVPTSGMSTPVPGPSNAPSSTPTPAPAPAPAPVPARSQSKRKYGPGAYLDARAEGRNSIGSEEANYFASAASRRDGRGENAASTSSFDSSFARRGTRPSIVQACICDDHEAERIKRPRNSFILFRSQKSEEIRKRLGTKQNQQVSRVASEEWNNAPPEVKAHYARLAEEEKRRHALKHPDYKYKPGGITRSKFGTPNCTCGAYEANMARVQEKKGGKRKLHTNQIDIAPTDDEDVDSDADATYRTLGAFRPAPVAQMTASAPPPDLDIASLGLPANQAVEASKLLAGMKRKHNLTISTSELGNIAEDAPRKARRSSRTTATVVNYAEPDEDTDTLLDDADLFDFNAVCKTPSTGKAERYHPVTPSPKAPASAARKGSSRKGSSPLFVTPSPPARNTRSQASPGSVIKIDSEDEDEDEGEEIVVATSKTGKKASGGKRASTRSQTARRRSLRRSGR